MPANELYLEHVDELAQQFVNTWGLHTTAGNKLDDDFMDVFNKACEYRTAKQVADSYRENNIPSETVAAAEQSAKLTFAQACKAYEEKKQKQAASGAGQK